MVQVLNVPLFDKSIEVVVNIIIGTVMQGTRKNYCISATGAHGIITAQNDKEFYTILQCFKYNLPDGMPGVWIGRLKGAILMQRCYGPDFFKALIVQSANRNINHFFCGGKEGVAENLKIACENKFNNHNVVGVYSPPFREMSDDEMYELAIKINALNTDIVWIGLSTPKQEKFAYRLSQFTNTCYICTVGAAFDFHTNNLKQAPAWLQKIGMEWLFRLFMEPKRLFKRYIVIVPKFILLNIKEYISGKFHLFSG